ncbi:glycosyltransferase family 2 protein [Paenibacillus sp. GSMTC-2017]|uniref:glycosyltransferase family 2 protein n=1 Tax=Paenibacillus sp. GSMTC-2017 TaxID=2794350 RepID=UPI0018D83E4C|nr:glycosyltransferase family 2 protein [Paenibacillus sp. GSMTC-2017]MBH5316735.1 glycosyltransferase family 2 protein [Paenibacillus sp. GSMTC-2017]
MISISLCMIVRNEEESLGRCLASVREAVDEIIIVDTGSTDRTKEIAASFDAIIYDFKWIDDFGAARNYAFERATQSYILWLDADDVVEEDDLLKLKELKAQEDFPYDSVSMNYNLSFDQEGKPLYSLRRNRLVRRACNFRWIGPVHEYLAVYGNIHHSDVAIAHRKERLYTDRNLQIYLKRHESGEVFSPRDQYYFANELRDHARYQEAIDWYEKFLISGHGWVEDEIAACMKQADCYGRLEEKNKQITSLLRTLSYDTPRAEFCCQLGSVFIEQKRFPQAIYWFTIATLLEKPKDLMSATDNATWTWLPHLQLTVCYDRIGDREKAIQHHKIARHYNPSHPSVLYNEKFFKGLDLV